MMPVRKRVRVGGVVQGVGFRPFVWRLARRHGLAGWVENTLAGVLVEVQGAAPAVEAFVAGLRTESPPLSRVESVVCDDVPFDPQAPPTFVIHETVRHPAAAATALVPPDIATCEACLADIRDPANRRHRHPFTTCTDCGPRFTIITAMPYDRSRTTMQPFAMCDACAAEYADPADRRFHAQPNACPACGPTAWFTTAGDERGVATTRPLEGVLAAEAIDTARERLRAGDILAVKGVGGFHLVCDATNADAVERLRDRKHRIGKPLAVMVADLAEAMRCAVIDPQEARIMAGRERPIVLVRKRHGDGPLAASVAPGNGFVGLMLPFTPLHHLLCDAMPPLVMTSGNLAEEPIVHANTAAATRLAPIVDGFLMHDREIHVPCDDSVVRCVEGAILPIRRARGYAPLPVRLAAGGRTVLAVGGELKAAICLAVGAEAFIGPHVGDMENLETLDAMERSAEHLLRLFGATPDVIACDMHPGYGSAAWARRFAADRGIPVVAVQHHEAHVAALLAEHGLDESALIGVCFDGTGYGRDGTMQGGEIFVVRDGAVRRAAHLHPFFLPGGDAGIRHPWRAALAMLHAAGIEWNAVLPPCRQRSDGERRLLRRQLDARLAGATTTSVGRLFDAVAALAGVRQSISYEAEAAMNLEALVAEAPAGEAAYPMPLVDGDTLSIDWRPALRAVASDAVAGCDPATIAARLHRGVAAMIVEACRRLRRATGIEAVGLTGGVFQNAWLVRLTVAALHAEGFDVLLHDRVPPNDGGLSLGQAVLARR